MQATSLFLTPPPVFQSPGPEHPRDPWRLPRVATNPDTSTLPLTPVRLVVGSMSLHHEFAVRGTSDGTEGGGPALVNLP